MPWLPCTHVNQRRTSSSLCTSCQGSQAPYRLEEFLLDTIKSNIEISQIFSSGRRIQTPYITFIVQNFPDEENTRDALQHDLDGRVAFIAGKKLGNAPTRNRLKRVMREICREVHGPWTKKNVIFLAKPSLINASYSKVLKASEKAVERFN